MFREVEVEECNRIAEHVERLSEILVKVVEDGASVGFLPPMEQAEARRYWENVLQPGVILLVAKINNEIVGSVQLHASTKQNGRHRAEIAKLMAHPDYRRKGIGRRLMQAAEARAKQAGRTLLVLDTREGDPSNLLYASLGYKEAGRIPDYARSADGDLHATVFYYKSI